MVINILDYVETTSTYADGEIIFKLISTALRNGESVTLSFDGVLSVPSAFINASLIQLLDEFKFEQIREKITFTNTTKHINELIRNRFKFVTSQQH